MPGLHDFHLRSQILSCIIFGLVHKRIRYYFAMFHFRYFCINLVTWNILLNKSVLFQLMLKSQFFSESATLTQVSANCTCDCKIERLLVRFQQHLIVFFLSFGPTPGSFCIENRLHLSHTTLDCLEAAKKELVRLKLKKCRPCFLS